MSIPSGPQNEAAPTSQASVFDRFTERTALLGGLLAVGVAALVVTSVVGRWLFSTPIEGDFEFVKMATAVAIFSYLPYTQVRRGNIMVDTFTAWLPRRMCMLIDAVWDLIYAAFMAFCAVGLIVGTGEAMASRETTMQLQLLIWPVIGVCALLCALLSLSALITAYRLVGGRS
jgi:TRAP-type C4-dicarboxylate transport system permease small subunit